MNSVSLDGKGGSEKADAFGRTPVNILVIGSDGRNNAADSKLGGGCGSAGSTVGHTRGLLGPAELALLKPTAYLVNTSRSAIVDQDALLAALREGRIAGAGVDVFDVEPLPAEHPLRTAPRLLATPHLGYVSRANYETYYGQASRTSGPSWTGSRCGGWADGGGACGCVRVRAGLQKG